MQILGLSWVIYPCIHKEDPTRKQFGTSNRTTWLLHALPSDIFRGTAITISLGTIGLFLFSTLMNNLFLWLASFDPWTAPQCPSVAYRPITKPTDDVVEEEDAWLCPILMYDTKGRSSSYFSYFRDIILMNTCLCWRLHLCLCWCLCLVLHFYGYLL